MPCDREASCACRCRLTAAARRSAHPRRRSPRYTASGAPRSGRVRSGRERCRNRPRHRRVIDNPDRPSPNGLFIRNRPVRSKERGRGSRPLHWTRCVSPRRRRRGIPAEVDCEYWDQDPGRPHARPRWRRPAALGAAAKTPINLSGRTWLLSHTRYRAAYVVITQHIAGTDDHRSKASHKAGFAAFAGICLIFAATPSFARLPSRLDLRPRSQR
jgi:hypothetical protein